MQNPVFFGYERCCFLCKYPRKKQQTTQELEQDYFLHERYLRDSVATVSNTLASKEKEVQKYFFSQKTFFQNSKKVYLQELQKSSVLPNI